MLLTEVRFMVSSFYERHRGVILKWKLSRRPFPLFWEPFSARPGARLHKVVALSPSIQVTAPSRFASFFARK